jgi:phospholipid-binding lipoprotein MlaA
MMKRFVYILTFLTVIVVPAFASDLSSSGPLHLEEDFQMLYQPDNDFPVLKLTDEAIIKRENINKSGALLYAQEENLDEALAEEEEEDLDYLEDEMEDEIPDPLEPFNRAMFTVNDKLYFWVLKPVAKGYSTVIPEPIRLSVRNFFNNVATPIRLVNSLLQFKMKSASNELVRFGINSTFGILGLYDVAKDEMGIKMQDEDFGQTLGVWGAGPVFYLYWPVLGPSNVRDSVGFVGDYFLDPVNYVNPMLDRYALKIGDTVNRTSLRIGDYEEIKKDAIDPYSAFKDIYYQYRKSKIER